MSKYPSHERKHSPSIAPPILLTDQGVERKQSKRVSNFPEISDDAASARLICCKVLNLNPPALGETTIPHYLSFELKMKETFSMISVRNTKNSRNSLFCQSDNFYNYKFPCPGSPPPTHLTGIFLEKKNSLNHRQNKNWGKHKNRSLQRQKQAVA